MLTILKYSVTLAGFNDVTKVVMPKNAKILTVGAQGNDVCIWAEVQSDEEDVIRSFEMFGTGHEMDYGRCIKREYLGSAFIESGFVIHVYERVK